MHRLPPASSSTVATALADAASFGPFFALTVGGPDTGWRPAADAYDAGVPELIADVAARCRTTEARTAASIVQLGHAARLWSPVLACAVAHGVLLDLGELHQAENGAALRLPAARGHHAPEGGRLADELYETVVTRHLDALAAGLRVKVARGLLYGNAASALVEAARAILAARPDLRAPLIRLTGELLDMGGLAGTGHLTGAELVFRRRSCCLYYRVPGGGTCGDCSLAGSAR